MSDYDEYIERRIVTGLVVSTEYLTEIAKMWNPRCLESATARRIAGWCIDYFHKYNKAPNRDIQGIYTLKKKEGLDEDEADDIAEILDSLSDDYERSTFNVEYLIDQSRPYFKERGLRIFISDIKGELSSGSLTEAEKIASSYSSLQQEESHTVDPFHSADLVRRAFEEKNKPLVRFPKELGSFWNDELTRDAFVALMGPEKRGKSFLLMEIGMRAMMNRCNVALFQAGDMTENQMIRRICIYVAKRSDQDKYCQGLWVPELDCVYNQTDECDREEREGYFRIFEADEEVNYEKLVQAAKDNPDYLACRNCSKIKGAPWLKWSDPCKPLEWLDAYKSMRKWRKRFKKRFKLSTYANETLSVSEIRSVLSLWERQERFIPDVIIIDYADILASDPDCRRLDFRNQQNKIWQRLRALSEERHCLLVTATQAAASSYDKTLIGKKDFSEDKRKYSHVTAMYGLNQTDEEKKIGVIRFNQLVIREDDFSVLNQVHVLQRLQIGRPFLGSYKG